MTTAKFPATILPIHEHVSRQVNSLQQAYVNAQHPANSTATARLALLRSGVTKPLGSSLDLIAATTAGLYDDDARLPDAPTHAEHAVYTAMTLYAVHQQSKRTGMHAPGVGFGRALATLYRSDGESETVRGRFNAIATATSWSEINHHARGVVGMLRARELTFDYGVFATDLYRLRFPASANSVRNRWGRDFSRPAPTSASADPADDQPVGAE